MLKSSKVIMTILVKNEIDIIEANIRTHANLGIDGFVVMDNKSTDGTRDILSKLQKEFDIKIIDENRIYNQSRFMIKLAKIAKKEFNANWVINNDADEFWIPKNDLSLKENLNFWGSVLTVNRYNMILQRDKPFFKSNYFVKNPIYYSKENQLKGEGSIILTKIAPKTIVNPKGLLYIRGGNHKALHTKNIKDYLRSGYEKIDRFKNIEVFHFPVRSYEQFKKNIENRKRLLESSRKVSMGPHYRRWVKLYNENRLEEEFYKNILFDKKDINTLARYNILQYNNTIKDKIIIQNS